MMALRCLGVLSTDRKLIKEELGSRTIEGGGLDCWENGLLASIADFLSTQLRSQHHKFGH